jgi:phosphate transport system permease protein
MKVNWEKLKNETIGDSIFKVTGISIIIVTIALISFILYKGLGLFVTNKYSVIDFLFSSKWSPDAAKNPQFGAAIFIVGTLLVSALGVIISTPFAFCVSIYTAELSKKLGMKVIKPFVEMLIGVPSVVYGWMGLSLLVPFIKDHLGGQGFSLIAGGIVLALMIFPTITSVTTQSLQNVSNTYKEASYALGATKWQTIKSVTIPAAMPGILTGIVLGLSRALGEALAVQMVIGNAFAIPNKLTDASITLTSIITMDMGNTVDGTGWNNALWSMALILLIISFICIFLLKRIATKEVK